MACRAGNRVSFHAVKQRPPTKAARTEDQAILALILRVGLTWKAIKAAAKSEVPSGAMRSRTWSLKFSLLANYGIFNELAKRPNRESLPEHRDWCLGREDSVDSEWLMLNQQNALKRDRFILGTRGYRNRPVALV
jgi:hypothetical protein